MSHNSDDQQRRRASSRLSPTASNRDRTSGQNPTIARGSAEIGVPSSDGSRSFRSWVRQAVSQEQGRADLRGLLRDHADSTYRRTAGEGRERQGSPTYDRNQLGHFSEESMDESSYESGEAVGPFDAGNPVTEMDKHHCELPSDIENEACPPLPMHPTIIQVLQKFLQPYFIVWPEHPQVRVILRSTAKIRAEQKRHVRSKYWYIIHPLSKMRFHWEIFISIVLLLNLILEPLNTAFLLGREENCSFYISILHFFCLMDCFSHFLTGIYVAQANTTILQPRKIARKYLSTSFIIDFVPSISVCWFFQPPQYELFLFVVLQLFLRLARLRLVGTYFTYFVSSLGFKGRTSYILMLTLQAMFVQHNLAMLHLYSIRFTCSENDLLELTRADCKYSWMVIGNITDESTLEKLKISFCRALLLSMCITIPQGPPHTRVDTFVMVTNIAIGSSMLIFIFIQSMFLRISKELNKISYEQIMMNVRDYVHYKKLTPDLKERLIVFYEYSLGKSAYNEPVIKRNLSRHLLAQVKQHAYREAVRSSGLFRGMPRSVCSYIVKFLTPVVLMRGDVFLRYGDACEAMFFVHSGAVAVVTNNGVETEHLQDGDYFGASGLLRPGGVYIATVVALEMTVVLRLERIDFMRALEVFPPFARRMREAALRRAEGLRRTHQQTADVETSSSSSDIIPPPTPSRDRR